MQINKKREKNRAVARLPGVEINHLSRVEYKYISRRVLEKMIVIILIIF